MRDTGDLISVVKGAARLLEVTRSLIAELHPSQTQPVTLDSLLDRDLGLDSLGRIELLARLEREFGVILSERAVTEADTPRDLLRVLQAAGTTALSGGGREVTSIELGDAEAAPVSAQTLIDVLGWHVDAHPDRPLIRFYRDDGEDDVATYRDIWEGARAVASGLQQRWFEPGGRVGIMLPTGRDYFFAMFGALLAGGVPVPVYPPARRTQIEDHLRLHRSILENAGATVLITVPEAKRFARVLTTQAVTTVDELSVLGGDYEQPSVRTGDIALLQYTSGSTGQPKGVVLTHANLLSNLRSIGNSIRMDDTDVVVSWLPLYHDMGLIGAVMGSLYYACPLVLMTPLDFIARPQRWLWAIHKYRGTLSASPNFGYELCVRRLAKEDVEDLDLSSWRVALNGAEPVSADTVERFCARFAEHGFGRQAMTPVYGLAESSLAVTFPPLGRSPVIDTVRRDDLLRSGAAVPAKREDEAPLRMVACGRPLPGHEVRIVDDGGRELPDRTVGRLQFRGPSACSGYFRNVEATRELFHGDWLDSGDLAYVGEGDVYITGRAKDIIIRAGRNIAPAELEGAIGDIAGVRKGNVAVFGSPDPTSGIERLVVVAETKETEASESLRRAIRGLAVDLVGTPPDDIQLVPPGTVLKTSSGKVRRLANRDIYERGELGKRDRPVWWQIARVSASGLTPWLRRARHRVAAWAFAVYAWGVLIATAPLIWTAVVIMPRATWSWFVARCAGRFLGFATGTTPVVHGLDRVPRHGGCVFVANHASYLDSFFLVAVLPRPTSFVAKRELERIFFVRAFLHRLRTRFVERFDKQKGVVEARRISATARRGWPLLYYPEGRLTRTPGLRPFHMGAFVTAAERRLTVVPIALRGTRSTLRPGTRFPRRAAVTVTGGSPIGEGMDSSNPAAKLDPWPVALRLRDASREHILRHCGEPESAD